MSPNLTNAPSGPNNQSSIIPTPVTSFAIMYAPAAVPKATNPVPTTVLKSIDSDIDIVIDSLTCPPG